LIQGLLNLPDNEDTIENLNYIFVGDEALSLHKHVLKPFSQRDLNHHKKIYNYRISRGRNIVENTFGLIASRFRILHTSIGIGVDKIIHVVLALCALHNYLRRSCSSYITRTSFDRENMETHEIEPGDWREENF
jgi:hypothetical protein